MHLLGIDVGTSGVKAVLVSSAGEVKAQSAHSYALSSPRNGWFEQNPEDWWEATVLSVRETLQAAGVKPSEVGGIGLSGQYHGLVILGNDGKVLRPSILWNDQRTAAQSARIQEKVGSKKLREICATPGAPYFTACKLEWVREHEPQIYGRVRKVMLPKDYIRYKLTGEICTDVTDASGTLFLNVAKRQWSREILRLLEVDPAFLPGLVESPAVSGKTCQIAAELTGLPAGIPVACGAGDQAAAAVGIGVVAEGIVTLSVGTSGVIYGATDRLVADAEGRFDTFCHSVPGKWCVLSCINSATASYQWYQDRLAFGEKQEAESRGKTLYEVLEGEAGAVPAGSDRLIFLPYLPGRGTRTRTRTPEAFSSGCTRATPAPIWSEPSWKGSRSASGIASRPSGTTGYASRRSGRPAAAYSPPCGRRSWPTRSASPSFPWAHSPEAPRSARQSSAACARASLPAFPRPAAPLCALGRRWSLPGASRDGTTGTSASSSPCIPC